MPLTVALVAWWSARLRSPDLPWPPTANRGDRVRPLLPQTPANRARAVPSLAIRHCTLILEVAITQRPPQALAKTRGTSYETLSQTHKHGVLAPRRIKIPGASRVGVATPSQEGFSPAPGVQWPSCVGQRQPVNSNQSDQSWLRYPL